MKLTSTLLVVFFVYGIATAQIFVSYGAAGSNDGSSWTNAFNNLQDALDAASDGSQIWIATGTYLPDGPTPDSSHFIVRNAVELYGGFQGTESQLSERNWEVYRTFISGDLNQDDIPGNFVVQRADNAHHVLIVDSDSGGPCVIDGLEFSGGMTRVDALASGAADLPYNRWRGGAIYVRTPAILRNCSFRDNYGYQGSAVYALRAAGELMLVENCLFIANGSIGGGTCYLSGGWNADVTGSLFHDNTTDNFGAGLVIGNSNALVRDCHYTGNHAATEGGGLFLFQNSQLSIPDPVITVENSLFLNNSSLDRGGGLNFNIFQGGFTMTINSCEFAGNASAQGGGLNINDATDQGDIAFDAMSVSIRDSDFSENSGQFGGGATCLAYDDSLSIEVTNTSFQSNYSPEGPAAAIGGGMYIAMASNAAVDARFMNVEFVANQVTTNAAGLYVANSSVNGRMHCDIDSATFINNIAESYAGALEIYGAISRIQNSTFTGNLGIEASGAFEIAGGEVVFENCLFSRNFTQGSYEFYEGGGAGILWGGGPATVKNSIFDDNTSDADGAALFSTFGTSVVCDNVLFHNNHGQSTYENRSILRLLNTSMVDNDFGLALKDSSVTEIQNSIFMNTGSNVTLEGFTPVTSKGGNLSSDASMSSVLTGFGEYTDLHDTDPLLSPDFVPLAGSPAIDAGNAEGVTAQFDLAGNPRISGKAIDIGSYESLISATKDAIWNCPGFTVFPNPVIETLNFELDMDWIGEFNLFIYNSVGQQVYQSTMQKSDQQQSFRQNVNLSPGQYVLLIPTSELTYAVNIAIAR